MQSLLMNVCLSYDEVYMFDLTFILSRTSEHLDDMHD